MSRRVWLVVSAVVPTLVITVSSGAAPAKTATTHSVVGTLEKYDASAKTLTISTAKGQETVMVSTATHVTSGLKVLSAGDLSSQTGERVKVVYADMNGQKMAQNIRIAAVPTTAAAAASPARKPANK